MATQMTLSLIERHKIALAPRDEGGWKAYIYDDEPLPKHKGYGGTPFDAVRDVVRKLEASKQP